MGRDFSASRAVLVGNSTFTDHRKLGDIPAAGCLCCDDATADQRPVRLAA